MLIGLTLPKIAYAQALAPEHSLAGGTLKEDNSLKNLVSTKRDLRIKAAVEIDEKRKQLINNLIGILNGTNSDKVKVDAVIVLGEYRASEAVTLLAGHLELDEATRGGFFNGIIRREEVEEKTSPVSIALEKIGMPAVPVLLEKIIQTDDAKITAKCASICQAIEGAEVTQFRLQNLLAKEADSKKKERIQSALDALKNMSSAK